MDNQVNHIQALTHLVLVTEDCSVTKRIKFLLRLTHQRVQARLHIGEFLPYMVYQNLRRLKSKSISFIIIILTHLIQRPGEILRPVFMRNISISGMVFEELGFRVESIRHTLLRDNILLASVDNANEA